MLFKTFWVNTLFALVLVLCKSSFAETVFKSSVDGGWYSVQGVHEPGNTNYVVGDGRVANCSPDVYCQDDFRNFFVFDLSDVTQTIASAKLAIHVSNLSTGYRSADPSENYELHDVTTLIPSLSAGTGGLAAHTDLGIGVVYGNRLMTAADKGNTVEINLNSSAIAAMNSTHGLFAIGGSITTLNPSITTQGEVVFGQSGGPQELRLTLVPEPSTLLLLGIGAISLVGYRKAKS